MKAFGVCFRALMRSLRSLRKEVAVSTLNGVVSVAASLAFVWCSKHVTDIATGQTDAPMRTGILLFLGVMLVQIVCRVFGKYWEGHIVVDEQNRSRSRIFTKVMHAEWNGREVFHSGDTVNRLEEDIRVVTDFLCVSFPEFLVTVIQLIAATFFLFTLSPSLAWILLIIMPAAVLGSRLFFRKMRRITMEIRRQDSLIQAHMQENIQHRIVVRTMESTDSVTGRVDMLQKVVRALTLKRLDYASVSRAFLNLGFLGGYAAAFLWGVIGIKNGTVTYGMMVAFLQLVGQIQRPVADITRHVPAFIRALSSEERLMELSELAQEPDEAPVLLEGAPGIRLEGLSFGYEGRTPVLSGLDFDFKPGTVTAILGPTGSGKSTLVRLVMALLRPTSGRIVLYEPETVSSVGTRCNFMYVPQGNSLMSGTIRETLHLAAPDATEAQLREALHLAMADFVESLPDGLDTVCSEVGGGLSEGQAQRIAIARALLRPGGVLILDEATSALDAETELELLERLSGYCRGKKTILCITHRPAATSYADAVLRL